MALELLSLLCIFEYSENCIKLSLDSDSLSEPMYMGWAV